MIFSRANLSNLAASIFIQCCGMVTGVLTARILGPLARGEFATVMLWPIIFSNLGLLGCNWALAREVANAPHEEGEWAWAALGFAAATAVLFSIAGFALLPYVLPHQKLYLIPLARICLLMVPLDIFNQVLLALEQGRMRWARYNWLRSSFFIAYTGFLLLIWAHGSASVLWFVWAFVASQTLAVAVRLRVQFASFGASHWDTARCGQLLRQGIPFFWATASNLLFIQFDKMIVIALLSTEAAGLYVVALAFGNAQSALADALGITSFALLSSETSVENRVRIITTTFRQSTLISAGLGVLLVCAIPLTLRPFFGAAFLSAVRPAMVLTIAASLVASTSVLNQGLRGAGRPYPGIASQVVSLVVLAVAAFLLLPGYGLMGMAWAVLLSACVQVGVLVTAAAMWLDVSPARFWPFRGSDIRSFCGDAALRWRDLVLAFPK